jgi:hypothetical protein
VVLISLRPRHGESNPSSSWVHAVDDSCESDRFLHDRRRRLLPLRTIATRLVDFVLVNLQFFFTVLEDR